MRTHAEESLPRIALEDAAKARLKRIGVIDVGSNSVRLVVFDGMARSPAYFYNEKVLCGLGAGLSDTGRLSPEGWERARSALHRFAALASRMELSGMIAVATAAVREAEDGPAFCDQIERETGLQLHVASGSEEARLAAQGVFLGWPDAEGLVCDMGGASMELARVNGGAIHACGTSPLGPLQLADIKDEGKRDKAIRKGMKAVQAAGARAGHPPLPRRGVVAGDRAARHGADRLSAQGAPRLRAADPAAARDARLDRQAGPGGDVVDDRHLAPAAVADPAREPGPRRAAAQGRARGGGGLGLRPARGPALPADARGHAPPRSADRGLPAHGAGHGPHPRLRRRALPVAGAALRGPARGRASPDPRRLPAARRQLAGPSRLPRRALLRIGDARQRRRA